MLTSREQILPVRADEIPAVMKSADRWVIWKAEPVAGKPNQLTKVPYQARNPERKAMSNQPSTWATYEEALAAANQIPAEEGGGLGFMLGDDWAAVDIDDAFDPVTGVLDEEAARIIADLASYAERSVSGTGIHILVRGAVQRGLKVGNCEVYSSGRYFTVTGHRIDGAPAEVHERDGQLLALWTELTARRSARRTGLANRPLLRHGAAQRSAGDLPEDSVIVDVGHHVCSGFTALWEGDTSAYDGDESRADMALFGSLAYLLGPGQESRLEQIARRSGLVRDKWNRPDYIERTISRAYEGRERFYPWSRRRGGAAQPRIIPMPTLADPNDPASWGCVDLRRPVTLNDVGFAKRLAVEASEKVRYVWAWDKWIRWDGQRWEIDDGAAALREAMALHRRLWHEFADLEHATQSAEVIKFVKSSGSAARLNAAVALATSQECLRVGLRDLDQHPYLFNVKNGTLDLLTGVLRPHDPTNLITQVADVEFHPGEGTGLWEQFVRSAMSGDEERVRFLQASAGLALSGDVSEQLLWCHYGRGSNGKSTFLTSLRKMLGDYAGDAPPDFLMMKNSDSHPTEIAALYGKRFVTAIECEAGRRLREAFVKLMTGGDPVAARRMREDFWTMYPTWKIHVAFNDPPTLSGTDDGIRRRLKIIPWRENFDGPRRDKSIKARLESEECRAEILNWCLLGFQDWWQAGGVPVSSAVGEATGAYVAEQDIFGQFIAEECIVGEQRIVFFADLMGAFTRWREQNGEHGDNWTAKRVGSELQRRGFQKTRPPGQQYRGKTVYRGLSRRPIEADPLF